MPPRSRPTSPMTSTTSIGRCGGASAGSWGRSRHGTRSASTPCSRRVTSPCLRRSSRVCASLARSLPRRGARPGGFWPPDAADRQTRSRRDATNAGASLVDLGDGVLAVEFHSKMNAIGGDTIEMMHAGLREAVELQTALVVGNDAANLLRRRQPDAAAARGAGRQLGRDRPDGPRVPAGDDGAQDVGGAGRRRARGADARRRLRDLPARRPRAGGGRERTSGWSKSASA